MFQLQQIVEFLQTFLMTLRDSENHLIDPPTSDVLCHHMVPHRLCCEASSDVDFCPTAADMKYCMLRLSLDAIIVYIVEIGGPALRLAVGMNRVMVSVFMFFVHYNILYIFVV